MFSVKEKRIYKYFNGERDVRGDPMAILLRLSTCPDVNFEADLKVFSIIETKPREGAEAYSRLVQADRHAFKIKPGNDDADAPEDSLPDLEVLELTQRFLAWVGGVKKNTSDSPTPPTSGQGPSNGGQENPIISTSSASGSTE